MFRYVLEDGKLTKTKVEDNGMTVDKMIKRTYSAPAVQYMFDCSRQSSYGGKRKYVENSIFGRGLGTKSYTPNNFTKWNSTRKCFVYSDNGYIYDPYDASNVNMTIRGYYLLDFDISTLPDANNPKANKKKYALLNTHCEDALADCRHWDKKAVDDPMIDFTKEDRLNEFRACWAVRQLLTKAFKAGKRINETTLAEMFVKKDYSSKYSNNIYTFGQWVRCYGDELIEILAAETERNGQSGDGLPDSDDGRP